MGPLFRERFISITVAEFSRVERRFKPSDSLHLSAAKCFSHDTKTITFYIHAVQTLTYMQDWTKLKKKPGYVSGNNQCKPEIKQDFVQLCKHGII